MVPMFARELCLVLPMFGGAGLFLGSPEAFSWTAGAFSGALGDLVRFLGPLWPQRFLECLNGFLRPFHELLGPLLWFPLFFLVASKKLI